MNAAARAVLPQTRRISAGISPAPGATSRLLAWHGRGHWLDVEVPEALDAHPEILKACHVARDTVLAVARAMASFADYRTGRNCRPTHARLTAAARCSQSTVQRAQRALKGLGLLAELVRGRSILTRSERLAAWERGSSHRQIASEFALLSLRRLRSRRAPKRRPTQVGSVDKAEGASRPVDRDHPTGALRVIHGSHLSRSSLRRRTEIEEGRSAPRSPERRGTGQARRLAESVRDRLGWLRGTSWRRLAPTLARFARAGWTVADVEFAAADVLAVRGHRVPRELRHPAAYLAGLLRDLDPAGMVRPSVEAAAYEAHLAEQRAADRAAARAAVLAAAGKCAHGVPANGAGVPSRGVLACLDCQRIAGDQA